MQVYAQRFRPVGLVLGAASVLLAAPASAQPYEWIGAGPGVWSDGSKWSLGTPPITFKVAQIDDGSTVTVDVTTPNLSTVRLGVGASDWGGLLVQGLGNELHGSTFQVGFEGGGDVVLDAGGQIGFTSTTLGVLGTPSTGTLTVNGGDFSSTSLNVGNQGTGSVVLNDGVIGVTGIDMAYGPGSVGTFTQLGGTLTSTAFYLGRDGEGIMSLQGGTAVFGVGNVGLSTIGPPTQLLIGGTADASVGNLTVGTTGQGVVTVSDGTFDVGSIYLTSLAVTGGEGIVNLEGGLLDVNNIYKGLGSVNQFNMTGGVLHCKDFGNSGNPLPFSPTGGLIRPWGDDTLGLDVFGDLNLGAGATLEMQIDTEFGSDRVNVVGTVTLAGSLAPVLLLPPDAGDTYTVISNDGVDAVVGEFAGLPEGTVITLFDGPDPYEYTISYVGGDGNDVVLQVACPADVSGDGVLDSGDLTTFTALFIAGDLSVDLNDDGYLDGGDISLFVAAYLAGC